MVKWIVGLVLVFLLIDHVWVHYGGPIAERLRGQYREDLKKGTMEKQEVQLQQSYKKSIIDELLEKVKSALKKDKEEQVK